MSLQWTHVLDSFTTDNMKISNGLLQWLSVWTYTVFLYCELFFSKWFFKCLWTVFQNAVAAFWRQSKESWYEEPDANAGKICKYLHNHASENTGCMISKYSQNPWLLNAYHSQSLKSFHYEVINFGKQLSPLISK